MDNKNRDVEETLNKLLERLNHALQIEYTFIIHYPYIVSFVDHEEAKKTGY
jgi:hypothetical protein